MYVSMNAPTYLRYVRPGQQQTNRCSRTGGRSKARLLSRGVEYHLDHVIYTHLSLRSSFPLSLPALLTERDGDCRILCGAIDNNAFYISNAESKSNTSIEEE